MIIYDLTYGYASKIYPARIFRTREEAEAFDREIAIDVVSRPFPQHEVLQMLRGDPSQEYMADAIIFLAKLIDDARLDARLAKRADEKAAASTEPEAPPVQEEAE